MFSESKIKYVTLTVYLVLQADGLSISKDVFAKAGLISCLDYYNERHAFFIFHKMCRHPGGAL